MQFRNLQLNSAVAYYGYPNFGGQAMKMGESYLAAFFQTSILNYIFSEKLRKTEELEIRKENPHYKNIDGPISLGVMQAYVHGRFIEKREINFNTENILRQLQLIRDINDQNALSRIIGTENIHIILGYLENTQEAEIYWPIWLATKNYLKSRDLADDDFGINAIPIYLAAMERYNQEHAAEPV